VKEYGGAGAFGQLAELADQTDREEREAQRAEERAQLEPVDKASALLGELGAVVDAAVASALTAGGCHRHKRGEWRRRRA
jgi:hypothetical protein